MKNRRSFLRMLGIAATAPAGAVVGVASPPPPAVASAWQEMLDAEMFASFPGAMFGRVSAEAQQ